MFTTLIVVLHVVVCAMLILLILLQTGKGADIGAVFGGGSSHTVFGSTGAATFLGKVTIAAAVTFMITSIVLTYFSGRGVPLEQSIMGEQSAREMPVGGPVGQPMPFKGEEEPVRKEGGAVSSEKAGVPSAGEKAAAPSATEKPAVPIEKGGGQSSSEKK